MESVCEQDGGTHECINNFGETTPWDLSTWKTEDIKEEKYPREIKVRQSNTKLVYLKMF
jgi:hypothetical protein